MVKNEIEKMQKIGSFWSNGWQDYHEDQRHRTFCINYAA